MSYVNPLNGRIRQAFDSDQAREIMDGLTQHDKTRLITELLNVDIYEICEREKFYKSLAKDDRKTYRLMLHAGLGYEYISFFLTASKKSKVKAVIKKFFDKKDIVRIRKDHQRHRRSKSSGEFDYRFRAGSFNDYRPTILHDDLELEFIKPRCNIG